MLQNDGDPELESITLRRGTLLVLFEILSRSYEEWQKDGPQPDDTLALSKPDPGERVASS
jgi:hypothetical protein